MSSSLERFVAGYTECAIWASTDNDGRPLDSLDLELDADSIEAIRADCAEFITEHDAMLFDAFMRDGYSWERAGHDYWLTRNGHGAGYWCRDELDEGDLGEALTKAAKSAGEAYVFVSDAGDCLYYVN
jgi:hypothetical protein